MSNVEKTLRAWTDPEYRASLTAEEVAELAANPIGAAELAKELESGALDAVFGGQEAGTNALGTLGCCETRPLTNTEDCFTSLFGCDAVA